MTSRSVKYFKGVKTSPFKIDISPVSDSLIKAIDQENPSNNLKRVRVGRHERSKLTSPQYFAMKCNVLKIRGIS